MVNLVSLLMEWPYITSLLLWCDKKYIASLCKNPTKKESTQSKQFHTSGCGIFSIRGWQTRTEPTVQFLYSPWAQNGFYFFTQSQKKPKEKIFHDTRKLHEIHISAHKGSLDCNHSLSFILSVAAFKIQWPNSSLKTCYSPQNDFIFSLVSP